MMSNRQQKLGLLMRKNKAQRDHPLYLTELSHVLKQSITTQDLIDLRNTDALLSNYNKGAQRVDSMWSLKASWPFEPNSAWLRICFCIAEKLESEPVALFAGPYGVCGAVRIKADTALVNASSVIAYDRDTLRIHALNSDGGLYLDLYEEQSARTIELKIWGSWCGRTEKCLDKS